MFVCLLDERAGEGDPLCGGDETAIVLLLYAQEGLVEVLKSGHLFEQAHGLAFRGANCQFALQI
jgi:hypothetical protein